MKTYGLSCDIHPGRRRRRVLLPLTVSILILSSLPESLTGSQLGVREASRREASLLTLVHRTKDVDWLNQATLSYLLQSSEIADLPAEQYLGITSEARGEKVRFQIDGQIREGALQLGVRVSQEMSPADLTDSLRIYLIAVANGFRDAVLEMRDRQSRELESKTQATSAEIAQAERKLQNVRESLRSIDLELGMPLITSAEFRIEPTRLRNEIASRSISEISCLPRPASGPSREQEAQELLRADLWRKVVILREEKLADLRRLAADDKVDPIALAEFEARLAEARAQASVPPSPLSSGKQQILWSDPESQQQFCTARLADLEKLQARLSRLEKLDLRALVGEMESKEKDEREAVGRLDTLRSQLTALGQQAEANNSVAIETLGGGP
jgi:hypothetical protein